MKRSVIRKVTNILKGKYPKSGLREAYSLIRAKHPEMLSREIVEIISDIKRDVKAWHAKRK